MTDTETDRPDETAAPETDKTFAATRTRLSTYRTLSREVEGWITDTAVAIAVSILDAQARLDITGDMLEIGAWHGKSAMLWMAFSRMSERTVIVDLAGRDPLGQNLQTAAEVMNRKHELMVKSSFRFPDPEWAAQNYRRFRLIHIDGDHSAAGIQNDLEVTLPLLHPFGAIVVDDFLNPRFPQISEVTFDFCNRHRHAVGLLASGGNKGFIVGAKAYDRMHAALGQTLPRIIPLTGAKAEIFEASAQNRPSFGVR
ncbi:MAG: class I SAM-dependent methyltransferase [Rubrimonas sp.]